MVTLDALLHHLAPNMHNLRQDCDKCRWIDRRSVSGRQGRRDFGARDGPRQECGGRGGITGGADVDVDDLALLVNGAKCIRPPPSNAYIRLVDAPLVPNPTAMRACSFLIQGREVVDPVENGGWIDEDPAFG